MKLNNIHKNLRLIAIILLLSTAVFSNQGFGQTPPPPPPPPNGGPGNGHGLGGNQGPVGAPIGGGMEVLLILGMAYAGRKWQQSAKSEEQE